MSNKTQLQANNTQLASLIQTLQGKAVGGGGGGASVETCTVKLGDSSYASMRPYCYSYTHLDNNGNVTSTAVKNNSAATVTLNNVVCGSVVTVYWYTNISTSNYSIERATLLTTYDKYFNAFKITASAGETAHIKYRLISGGDSDD